MSINVHKCADVWLKYVANRCHPWSFDCCLQCINLESSGKLHRFSRVLWHTAPGEARSLSLVELWKRHGAQLLANLQRWGWKFMESKPSGGKIWPNPLIDDQFHQFPPQTYPYDPLVNEHSCGKSPFIVGRSTINGQFSIAMLVITRGYSIILPNTSARSIHLRSVVIPPWPHGASARSFRTPFSAPSSPCSGQSETRKELQQPQIFRTCMYIYI